MRKALSTAAVVSLILFACAEPSEQAATDPTDTEWSLESGTLDDSAVPVLETHPITLVFTEDGAGGTAACNHYSGSYTLSGAEIGFGEITQTEMACIPEEVMASESAFLTALSRVENFTATDGSLTMSGDGVELVFVALPAVPDAGLTSTVWVLDGLVQGDSVSSVGGDRATLEMFSDGSLLGSTGCRSLSGNYVITGGAVSVTGLGADGACPSELTDQDAQVVTILSDGFAAEVEGNTLTLTSPDGLGLVYLATD
jgi:heat shock protein HslJ